MTDNYVLTDFKNKIFEFNSKDKIRLYQQPPVRNFLVEDLDGKWLYWGLCFVLEVHHDYLKGTTSGSYKIVRINDPIEMQTAFKLADFDRPELNYF